MTFKILRPGTHTTLQDDGRNGFYHLGITVSGAIDKKNFKIGNIILNNKINEPSLEFALQGPLLEFNGLKSSICITGDVNFEIIRIFGLNEPIDTIFTTQPDGLNWRGVTPSHELTGLWLLIITCCSINMFLKTKKVYFILTLALNLIALSWNSQRTPLILLFFTLFY